MKRLSGILISLLVCASPFSVLAEEESSMEEPAKDGYVYEADNPARTPYGTEGENADGDHWRSLGDGTYKVVQTGCVYDDRGTLIRTDAVNQVEEGSVVFEEGDPGCFVVFTGIAVDGNPVEPVNYKAREGSVVIELGQEYIDTLQPGSHTLTCYFVDRGGVDQTITIVPRRTEESVKQKDTESRGFSFYGMIAAGAFLLACGMFLIISALKR